MDQTRKNFVPFFLDIGIYITLILLSVLIELAFGFRGFFFMALVAIFSRKQSLAVFGGVLFLSSLAYDMLFFHLLGSTGLVYGLAFIAFHAVRQISRWRMVFYLVFGTLSLIAVEILAGDSSTVTRLLLTGPLTLFIGWMISKVVLFSPVLSQHQGIFLKEQ